MRTTSSSISIQSAINLTGLTKTYAEQTAVAKLDLMIEAGALMVFVGPSGCGKTTTLRMIGLLLLCNRPSAPLGSASVTSLACRRACAISGTKRNGEEDQV